MAQSGRIDWAQVKGLFWPSSLLCVAFLLALGSSVAKTSGQFYAAAFLAFVSLLLGGISSIFLIPRLLARIRIEWLEQFRLFRFTRRGVAFTIIILVVAVSALNTGNNLLILVLSVMLASFVVSGIVSNLVLYGLKISLTLPESIHAGQQATFFLSLHNLKKLLPSFAIRLRGDELLGPESKGSVPVVLQERFFPYVRAGEEVKVALRCQFPRRGVFSLDGFDVVTQFPFGFFARGRRLETHGSILVYPALRNLETVFRTFPQLLGTVERYRRGVGSGLYNIRSYRSGDPRRSIHWKSTAKLSRLMVKDFSAEENSPLQVVFSTFVPERNEQTLAAFESAVSLVASLGRLMHSEGINFDFYSGELKLSVQGGDESYSAFMEYLACVAPSPSNLLVLNEIVQTAVIFAAERLANLGGAEQIDYLQIDDSRSFRRHAV